MPGPGIAGYITGWRPSSVSPQAADFARAVVAGTGPGGRERAKNLLWAAGRPSCCAPATSRWKHT